LILSYLLAAYRNLETFSISVSGGVVASEDLAKGVTSAISDIQLFGSSAQIELAVELSDKLERLREVHQKPLNDLIFSLRNNLREELGLNKEETPIKHIIITYSDPKNEKNNIKTMRDHP